MEVLLVGIYAFFVWLVFIKFKWLPWSTTSQIIVVITPIVALTTLVLTLNVIAPSSEDVRVFKYTVQVLPQVRGRVIEVPVQPNRLVKKGELLFRRPHQLPERSGSGQSQARGQRSETATGGCRAGECIGQQSRAAGATGVRE